MAFAFLLLKARRIRNRQKRLKIEKEHALKIQAGEKPKYTLSDKYQHCIVNIKTAIKKFWNRIFSFPKNSWMHKFCVKLRNNGTLENYLLKSLVGFIGGFFLIYVFFMFFVIILNFSLGVATLICSIFGCILTIGLAFSQTVRQVVFLVLPQFFSKRGRQALLVYALILTLTGPAKNTLNNMGIMSESLACGQEQLKQAVKQIIDMIKKPFIAIKEAIKKIIDVVKVIVKKIKEIFLTIKRIVMCIARVIKSAFQFLGKIFNICSKKVGTPYDRCIRVFDNAVTDCYAKLGPLFSWLCSIVYVTKVICYIVKPLDFICMLLDFISSSIIGVIVRKIKKFIRHVRSTFYVKIKFSHSFKFETTASKSMKEVTQGIVAEIRERTKKINEIFSFIGGVTSLFFFIIILKAIVYRYKFLTNDRFDNKYITKNFREIDFRRARMERETILPLNHREKKKYVYVSSVRLVKEEKKHLFKSLAILTMATFKLGTHIFTDYSLWWILDKIRFYGKYTTSVEVPRTVGLNVQGKGFVADLFRSVVKAFNPLGTTMNIDTVPCLPDPIPPDYEKYIQIGFTLGLCWLLAILEPYGLRLRAFVLNYYYPNRARERAVWLFNHILRNRTSFLKFARRQLRRKFPGQKNPKETKITCKEFLRARLNVKFLRWCLKPCIGSDHQEACVLCAEVFRPGEEKRPIRCSTPGCPGMYCEPCFNDLQNIYTICLDPIQYGDLSDVDEEKDSSEDETSEKYKRRRNKKLTEEPKKKRKDKKRIDKRQPRLRGGYDILFTSSSSSSSEEFSDSGNSTDYSYSYQYEKKISEFKSSLRTPFVDIEEQYLPDYVSMDTFEDYLFHTEEYQTSVIIEKDNNFENNSQYSSDEENCFENNPLIKKKYKQSKSYSSSGSDSDFATVESKTNESVRYHLKSNRRKVKKWLSGKTMFHRHKFHQKEELIPLLNLQLNDYDTSSSDEPKSSTIYSVTSISESIKSERKTERYMLNNKVEQKSNRSISVESFKNETDVNSRLNYLFPNIKYEEINENTTNFTNTTYLYTSETNSKSVDAMIKNRRKQSSISSSSISENITFNLENRKRNNRKYKDKIRQYYKNLPKQSQNYKPKIEKKNRLLVFLSKIFFISR